MPKERASHLYCIRSLASVRPGHSFPHSLVDHVLARPNLPRVGGPKFEQCLIKVVI